MKNPALTNEILKLILKEYESKGINSDILNEIVQTCKNLVAENKHRLYKENIKNFKSIRFYDAAKFRYPDDSIEFPEEAIEPDLFIEEFLNNFDSKYHTTERIFKNVADQLFHDTTTEKIIVHLGQQGDDIIFCVKKDGVFFRISDVNVLEEVPSTCFDEFHADLGSKIDQYLLTKESTKKRNTRKFEITRNVYDYLIDKGYKAILCFPCICMDDDANNPAFESYKYRYTYMMTFGDESSGYQKFPNVSIFDRNGLCPPGSC